MLTDLVGRPLGGVVGIPTVKDPGACVANLAATIKSLVAEHEGVDCCEGIGVVVPGMVEYSTKTGAACADARVAQCLARRTARRGHRPSRSDRELGPRLRARAALDDARRRCRRPATSSYVSVSDGLGVGVVVRGEALRGRHNIAGEFGHVPLSLDGPSARAARTAAGKPTSRTAPRSRATSAARRKAPGPIPVEQQTFTVEDLIARARDGEAKATAALQSTAQIPRPRASPPSSTRSTPPAFTSAAKSRRPGTWSATRSGLALGERVLTPAAASTPITPVAPPSIRD